MNELGLNFLRWMQEHRTPGGEEFFLQVTEWGEGFWLMAVLGVLFWVFGMFGVLVHAHAPTDPDDTLQRVVIACALGAVLATAALAFLARVGPRGARARAGTIV